MISFCIFLFQCIGLLGQLMYWGNVVHPVVCLLDVGLDLLGWSFYCTTETEYICNR